MSPLTHDWSHESAGRLLQRIKYDEHGRVTKVKLGFGRTEYHYYEHEGEQIRTQDKENGYTQYSEYDDKGNLIYEIATYPNNHKDDYEEWRKHDENGRLIQVKDQFGYEENREYDENGNLVSIKDEEGNEVPEP